MRLNFDGRWISKIGALIIVLGFFLPFVSVSCAGQPVGEYSLAKMADVQSELNRWVSEANLGSSQMVILYLVPVFTLIGFGLSFIPSATSSMRMVRIIGQAISYLIGLIVVLGQTIQLYNNIGQAKDLNSSMQGLLGPTVDAISVNPAIGLYMLMAGYFLVIFGMGMQFFERSPFSQGASIQNEQFYDYGGSVDGPTAGYGHDIPNQNNDQLPFGDSPACPAPQLEVVKGLLASRTFMVDRDKFFIGRGSDNHLRLQDKKVSRQHAVLRTMNGTWFIQDLQSGGGIYVNNQRVPACPLSEGDRIKIGDSVFIFRK